MIGQRIAHYEIHASLGAGGMGEVYRARDTKLGRDVALKLLPRSVATDADRLSRFSREARVLASLNHPHIAAIYGIEDAGPSPVLVLELVEGETLAERLVRGSMAPAETIALARQIALALDAAHERGIVHRDLKPANVKITPDGVLKVLDFGLAKAVDNAAMPPDAATMSLGQTSTGVIVGTASYMSPEQARGQPVDKRTDIWAFGCVVFEMLTGRAAFASGSLSDTLAAVLEREPDWAALPASTPARLVQLLRRCLEKKSAARLRDIGDALFEMDEHRVDREPALATSNARRFGLLAGIAAAALAIGVAGSMFWFRGAASPASPTDLGLGTMTRFTSDAGLATEPSISSDGRLVAYASNRLGTGLDVYVQQTTGGTAIRLTADPADDREPSIAPDGSQVAFRSERQPSGIYVASTLGGDARLLAPGGRRPRFSPDGRQLAFWTGPWLAPRGTSVVRRVFVMPAAGGAPTPVGATLASAGEAAWAPDGKSLLVFGRAAITGTDTNPDWWWVPLDGRTPVRTGLFELFETLDIRVDSTDVFPVPHVWSADGVLFTGSIGTDEIGHLWTVPIDPASGRVLGAPVRLSVGTAKDTEATMSADGHLVFSAQNSLRTLFAQPLEADAARATGPLARLINDPTTTGRATISADGRLILLPKYQFDTGGVWLRHVDTGVERQLAVTPRTPLNPVISSDGRWAGYTVTKVVTGGDGGPGEGYVIETTGGVPSKICENCVIDGWTRDNRFVVIRDVALGQPPKSLIRVDVATGTRSPILEGITGPLGRPMFAPNGRWMTFNRTGTVFAARIFPDRPAKESEWVRLFSGTRNERTAGMSPDGGVLYLLLERDGFRCLWALKVDPDTGAARGEPFVVAHLHDASLVWGSTGMGSAVARGLFLADLFETTGNLWMTTLRRR